MTLRQHRGHRDVARRAQRCAAPPLEPSERDLVALATAGAGFIAVSASGPPSGREGQGHAKPPVRQADPLAAGRLAPGGNGNS